MICLRIPASCFKSFKRLTKTLWLLSLSLKKQTSSLQWSRVFWITQARVKNLKMKHRVDRREEATIKTYSSLWTKETLSHSLKKMLSISEKGILFTEKGELIRLLYPKKLSKTNQRSALAKFYATCSRKPSMCNTKSFRIKWQTRWKTFSLVLMKTICSTKTWN